MPAGIYGGSRRSPLASRLIALSGATIECYAASFSASMRIGDLGQGFNVEALGLEVTCGVAHRGLLRGSFQFIFQPAEEGPPKGEDDSAETRAREGAAHATGRERDLRPAHFARRPGRCP